jgi:hypothetical protein
VVSSPNDFNLSRAAAGERDDGIMIAIDMRVNFNTVIAKFGAFASAKYSQVPECGNATKKQS